MFTTGYPVSLLRGNSFGAVANLLSGHEQRDVANVVFGVVSTLAPDIDFLVYLVKKKGKLDKFAYEHRELLHHPLFFSLGGAALIMMFNKAWAAIWLIGTLYHFAHDTFTAWGMQWGWPFTDAIIIVRSDYQKRLIKNRVEQRRIVETLGNDNWGRDENLTVNPGVIVKLLILDLGAYIALPIVYFAVIAVIVPIGIILCRCWHKN